MKTFLNEAAKLAIAVVLGMVCLWFLLSFKWSLDEMSTLEKVVGVVYGFVMVPLYCGIKKALGLQ